VPNPLNDLVALADQAIPSGSRFPAGVPATATFVSRAVARLTDVYPRRIDFLINGSDLSYYPLPNGYTTGARTGSAWTNKQVMTQATSGATGVLDAPRSSDTVMKLVSVTGTPDATHVWTGGGATFTPTAAPLATGWENSFSDVSAVYAYQGGDFTKTEGPAPPSSWKIGEDALGNDLLRFLDSPFPDNILTGMAGGSGSAVLHVGDVARIVATGRHFVTSSQTSIENDDDSLYLADLVAALKLETAASHCVPTRDQSTEEDIADFDHDGRSKRYMELARRLRDNFNLHFGVGTSGSKQDEDEKGSTAFAPVYVAPGDVVRTRHTHSYRRFG
jgi:hypothetical protein